MAVVDLDNAPSWWRRGKGDHLSAAEARALAGTTGAPQGWMPSLAGAAAGAAEQGLSLHARALLPDRTQSNTRALPLPPSLLAGPVRLLTHPPAAGYSQNPISVYYCYAPGGQALERCIAEVTNTPWGERVTFLFRCGAPRGAAAAAAAAACRRRRCGRRSGAARCTAGRARRLRAVSSANHLRAAALASALHALHLTEHARCLR